MSVNCPQCDNTLAMKKETVKDTDLLVFRCPNHHIICVTNDMLKIEDDIKKIKAKLGILDQ